jgi:hypothetical protein
LKSFLTESNIRSSAKLDEIDRMFQLTGLIMVVHLLLEDREGPI